MAVFLPGWDNDGIALAPPQARDGFETLLGQEEKAREEHGAGRYDGQHDGCRWTLTILRWKEPSAAVAPVRLTLLQANAANYNQTNDRRAAINAGRAIRKNSSDLTQGEENGFSWVWIVLHKPSYYVRPIW